MLSIVNSHCGQVPEPYWGPIKGFLRVRPGLVFLSLCGDSKVQPRLRTTGLVSSSLRGGLGRMYKSFELQIRIRS